MQIVVHYAEIGLKGRNRPRFEDRLLANLERALQPLGGVRTRKLFGRLLVELPDSKPFEEASARISRVFGVAWFARAILCEPTIEAIERATDQALGGRTFESFGVRARRPDKTHPYTSRELEAHIGSAHREADRRARRPGRPRRVDRDPRALARGGRLL